MGHRRACFDLCHRVFCLCFTTRIFIVSGLTFRSLISFEFIFVYGISSVQYSCSVVYDSLWPHGLQHTRPPYPTPTPGVYPNSCSMSQWWHPTITSSVVPFSYCLQSFPASGSFLMSQLFSSGGWSFEASVSATVLPVNIQHWFRLGWTGLISLLSKGLKSLLQHHSSKASVLRHSASFMVQLSHLYLTTRKIIALTIQTFVQTSRS